MQWINESIDWTETCCIKLSVCWNMSLVKSCTHFPWDFVVWNLVGLCEWWTSWFKITLHTQPSFNPETYRWDLTPLGVGKWAPWVASVPDLWPPQFWKKNDRSTSEMQWINESIDWTETCSLPNSRQKPWQYFLAMPIFICLALWSAHARSTVGQGLSFDGWWRRMVPVAWSWLETRFQFTLCRKESQIWRRCWPQRFPV